MMIYLSEKSLTINPHETLKKKQPQTSLIITLSLHQSDKNYINKCMTKKDGNRGLYLKTLLKILQ